MESQVSGVLHNWQDPESNGKRKPETALPLFDAQTHSRRHDPQTSKAAAEQASRFAHSHCQKIHAALVAHGPMGKTRIAKVTGIDHVAVARRLADLERKGEAMPTGDTEKSGTGREERIWRAL